MLLSPGLKFPDMEAKIARGGGVLKCNMVRHKDPSWTTTIHKSLDTLLEKALENFLPKGTYVANITKGTLRYINRESIDMVGDRRLCSLLIVSL
jgi:hypothetical protein